MTVTDATKKKLSRAAKRRDMKCRAPRCRTRSLGPRFRYFCTVHSDNFSETEKAAFLAAYAAKHPRKR